MFNWGVVGQLWSMAGIMLLGATWLYITLLCAWGQTSKRFQIIWLIFNALVIIAGTILIGFMVK